MLQPGRKGIGFAVGREPLPALFAERGAEVLATDQPADAIVSSWRETGQHAASREALFHKDVCSRDAFDARVRFEPLDMTQLDRLPRATFDFAWSSCSFEHLGSLEAGLEFVLRSTELLRPGGVAVHTTEFNVSSNTLTEERGSSVIYRQRDLELLDRNLRAQCAGLARLDLFAGDHPADLTWDYPPYFENARPHLKLLLHGHVATSILLIVHKGEPSKIPQNPAAEMEHQEIAATNGAYPEIAALVERLTAQALEIEQARAALNAVTQSTSWRMTAPLRAMGCTLKGKN